MKKYAALTLSLFCIMLAGCNGNTDSSKTKQVSLEELIDDYTIEQAKEDGCVIYENGDITCGQEVWDAFVETVSAKNEESSVRLGFYYTLDDPSRYDPDYYESIKDDYPLLFIQDLNYDSTAYTLRWFEDGEEIIRTYQYLMKYEGDAERPNGRYDSYVRYVLTNDNSVTWEDILRGTYSSQFGDFIDHHTVYVDLM